MAMDFLTVEDVLEIHLDQIQRYGGDAGVRDMGLLDSAVAMPKATFGGDFLHADIFEMAAAYVFHIAKNHPFVDGNKRTSAVAACMFLELNGVRVQLIESELVDLILDTAQSKIHKPEIAAFFRRNAAPPQSPHLSQKRRLTYRIFHAIVAILHYNWAALSLMYNVRSFVASCPY